MISRVLALAGLVATLLVAAPATAAPDAGDQVAQAPLPALHWGPCVSEPLHRTIRRDRVSCARVQVPLDYDRPDGARTPLLLARSAATDPGRRIGTLFVNPGGPGAPASDFVSDAARALGPRVAARFDVVGIDPRGTGGSGSVGCRGPLTRPLAQVAFPVSTQQVEDQLRLDDDVRRACRRHPTPLLDHASTADVARDMELVRRALGEEQLSYYGVSYGSHLGTTYAAMFPGRVRALAVDGVLDPVAWSGSGGGSARRPFSTRIGSAAGTYEALTSAFAACRAAGSVRCPLAADPQGAWDRVLAAAARGRLVVEGARVSTQTLIGTATSALYAARAIPPFLRLVAGFERSLATPAARADSRSAARTAALHRRLARLHDRRVAGGPFAPLLSRARPRTLDLASSAVMCSDSRNPDAPRAWVRAAAEADRTAPGFGASWTWLSSVCADGGIGSGADAFRGPWRTRTATPLLVIGNSHDPATPITGARRVHDLFAGSRLLTYDGWGHAALGSGRCVTRVVADYLVEQRLPRRDVTCAAPPLFPGRGR